MKSMVRNIYRISYRLARRRGLHHLWIANTIKEFVEPRLLARKADVHGHVMFLDQHDCFRLSLHSTHWPMEAEVVRREIKAGDTVIDLGANIGYYTLLFARQSGTTGKVMAFEPSPENFTLLTKNIRVNKYSNVILVQKAIANVNGTAWLELSPDHIGAHTIWDTTVKHRRIPIETVRLDDYLSDYPRAVDFIKMDIQGAEGMALDGMQATLSANRNIRLLMEFAPSLLRAAGTEPVDCLESLAKQGFRLFEISEVDMAVTLTTQAELLMKYPSTKVGFTNLLCVR